MTNSRDTRIVFSMRLAGMLIKQGHKVIETLPNPRNPQVSMFLFQADETFDEDFKKLQEEVCGK